MERVLLMTDEHIAALERVLEYLQEEGQDYYNALLSGEDVSNHIWLSVKILMDYHEG